MSKFMSDLDAQSGKVPFQTYAVMHGIEAMLMTLPATPIWFAVRLV